MWSKNSLEMLCRVLFLVFALAQGLLRSGRVVLRRAEWRPQGDAGLQRGLAPLNTNPRRIDVGEESVIRFGKVS